MHPKDALNAALKEAMKTKQNERRDVIRSLLSAIKQVEIDTRADVSPEQVVGVLQKEVKSHRETITELGKASGDHSQMIGQSEFAIGVISEFLPQQLTRDEIEALVKAAIAETGAASGKDMGKVMGVLQPQTKGRADGKLVSEIVKAMLG